MAPWTTPTPVEAVARHLGLNGAPLGTAQGVDDESGCKHEQAPALLQVSLAESLTEAEQYARTGECAALLPDGARCRSQVLSWIQYFRELEKPLSSLVSPNRGMFDRAAARVHAEACRAHCMGNPAAARAAAELLGVLGDMDEHIQERGPFLLGPSLSFADICGICTLIDAFRFSLPRALRDRFASVVRWVEACLESPAFSSRGGLGGVEFCEWPGEEEASFVQKVDLAVASSTSQPPRIPTGDEEGQEPRAGGKQGCVDSAEPPAAAGRDGGQRCDAEAEKAVDGVTSPAPVVQQRSNGLAALGIALLQQEQHQQQQQYSNGVTPSVPEPQPVSKGAASPEPAPQQRSNGLALHCPAACKPEVHAPGTNGHAGGRAHAPAGRGAWAVSGTPDSAPVPALGRPAMRVTVGPKSARYNRPWRHDDVVVVPGFCCGEDDWSVHHQLKREMPGHRSETGASGGANGVCADSPTLQRLAEQMCFYFELDPASASACLSGCSSAGWRPLQHALSDDAVAQQNITVGVSLGEERELTLLHCKGGTCTSLLQTNGMLFAFGRDVSINFQHGVSALPADLQQAGEVHCIMLRGRKADVVEDGKSLPVVHWSPTPAPPLASSVGGGPGEARPSPSAGSPPVSPPQPLVMHGAPALPRAAPGWSLLRSLASLPSRFHRFLQEAADEEAAALYGATKDTRSVRAAASTLKEMRSRGARDPWQQGGDPWSTGAQTRNAVQRNRSPDQGAWANYRLPAGVGLHDKAQPRADAGAGGVEAMFLRELGCTREAYVQSRIHRRLQARLANASLTDTQVLMLGRARFSDQDSVLLRLQAGELVTGSLAEELRLTRAILAPQHPGAPGRRSEEKRERPRWEEDEACEDTFWWRKHADSLCFDLAITDEDCITDGAPMPQQWWDVDKLTESENYVAISKPAGMFVVTDERGLWEESCTNFIHVAHQRYEMASRHEPRQRGICHRLDSHTSGVQVFGKSFEAFEHFITQNSAHRMHKEYVALVCGRLGGQDGEPVDGLVDVPLKKWRDFGRHEFGSVVCAKEGLPAVTRYRALRHYCVPAVGGTKFWGKERWFTLVQLRILTGRTHQIRVHMAYVGHPLVGDVKYNPTVIEEDFAVVPRIFLHCLRMEFEDYSGECVVAVSDLAPDLQAALNRIQRLADATPEKPSDGEGVQCPGLADLLRRSSHRKVCAPAAAEKEQLPDKMLRHQCWNCGCTEEATGTVLRRDQLVSRRWCLTTTTTAPRAAGGGASAGTPPLPLRSDGWGPGMLWVPTELREQGSTDTFEDSELREPGPGELQEWSPYGTEWAWAFDGSQQNGWIRMHAGGRLASKWGPGTWSLLGKTSPPLLLVAFRSVEHALRLLPAGGRRPPGVAEGDHAATFDIVMMRRLAHVQKSLAEDPGDGRAFQPDAPTCCATIGWPDAQASSKVPPLRY